MTIRTLLLYIYFAFFSWAARVVPIGVLEPILLNGLRTIEIWTVFVLKHLIHAIPRVLSS